MSHRPARSLKQPMRPPPHPVSGWSFPPPWFLPPPPITCRSLRPPRFRAPQPHPLPYHSVSPAAPLPHRPSSPGCQDIVSRGDGEKELMEALKEMGIKKMGHRQTIVGAVLGKL